MPTRSGSRPQQEPRASCPPRCSPGSCTARSRITAAGRRGMIPCVAQCFYFPGRAVTGGSGRSRSSFGWRSRGGNPGGILVIEVPFMEIGYDGPKPAEYTVVDFALGGTTSRTLPRRSILDSPYRRGAGGYARWNRMPASVLHQEPPGNGIIPLVLAAGQFVFALFEVGPTAGLDGGGAEDDDCGAGAGSLRGARVPMDFLKSRRRVV